MTELPTSDPLGDLRCTIQTRLLGEHPAGTAGGADRYVLVDVPLPWPADIGDHPLLATAGDPDAPAPVGRTKLLGVTATDGPAAADREDAETDLVVHARGEADVDYARWEGSVLTAELGEVLGRIRAGDLSALSPVDPVPEVLVCAHGSRDRCCGSLGTLLALELAADDDLVVRRASHLGGHRFAPTVLAFPAGLGLAHVDAGHVRTVLGRDADPSGLERHLRGWLGLPDGRAQRADVAALAALGWGWWDRPRTATVVDDDEATPVVFLADGAGRTVTVVLRSVDAYPVPVCGEPLDAAKKQAAGYDVISVEVGRD